MNTALLSVLGAIDQAHAMSLSHACRSIKDMKEIDRVVLLVDSPGGTVAGISELAQDVRELAAIKPVVAFIRNRGASAGYWIASQATEIVAEPSAFVGSLGVAAAMVDTSAAAEQAGIKVTLVTSGGVKGAGTPGTPITAEHIAAEQKVVDAMADMFKTDVQTGRELSKEATAKLFDGQMHVASAALALGLIDRIGTLESVLRVEPTASSAPVASVKEPIMTDPVIQTAPATTVVTPVATTAPAPVVVAVDHMANDIKAIAESVKSAGCPLTLDSIVAKLTAAVEGEKDSVVAVEKAIAVGTKLSKLPKIAGNFAPTEKPVVTTAEALPTDIKGLKAQWDEKYQAARKTMSPADALVFTRDKNPELHKAYIEKSTELWQVRGR
jgi:signal peptide peptidase SppA